MRRPLLLPTLILIFTAAALSVPAFAGHDTPKDTGQHAKGVNEVKPKSAIVPAGSDSNGTVNLGATVKDRSSLLGYKYKGVELPLKKFVEYEGTNPFVEIVDGADVLWVARRGDLFRMLDRVLYAQLDTMTGAADDLYERHRYPAAYQAYKDVLDVLTSGSNELNTPDLEHYPAVKSYLLYRMGQSRNWQALATWEESETLFRHSDESHATAERHRTEPAGMPLAPVDDEQALAYAASARAEAQNAEKLQGEARTLLENAAQSNDRLWQAQNELGILAMARAARLSEDQRIDDAEKEVLRAEDLFKKARSTTDAKEIVDANLIAAYSARADIDHQRGKYTEGLDLLRQAMEITPDLHLKPEEARTAMTDPVDSAAFEVEFSGYQPARGERVVITAELESAIARKYLEFERDRRLASAHPAMAEQEAEVPARWRAQGERLMQRRRWRSAVAFYAALYDLYVDEQGGASASADFKDAVRKNLEKAFGERANTLVKAGRDDEALSLYALALRYVPNSRVLMQAQVFQAFRKADEAMQAARWEEVVREIKPIYDTAYKPYDGPDLEKKRTRDDIANKLGAAYVGLTRGAMERGDLKAAASNADEALALYPPRTEWKENKARVVVALAQSAEKAGDLDGALKFYQQAAEVGAGPVKLRALFSRDVVRAELFVPEARRWAAAGTRQWGWAVALGLFGLGFGIPAARGALSAASRRRRAGSLRAEAVTAYTEKRWPEAVALFNEYFANTIGPADPESFELLARSYRKTGDYENALRFFDRAESRLPGRRYNLERAEIYLVRRNLALAIKALRGSAELKSDAEKLIHFLNFLREKDGESLFVTEALAAVQMTAGDLESARQLYLRLLETNPLNPSVLRKLAELARMANQTKERRSYLTRLAQIDSNDVQTLRALGNLLASEGELPDAIEYFRRAQEVAPIEGLAARMAELQAELLVREAEAEIERLGREMDTPIRRFRIGELHWRLGRVTEAKKYFEEAAGLREYQARALRYLGLIAVTERHYDDAISLLRGYLAKRTNLAPDPPEKEARYALAEAYENSGKAELALAQYEAIFEADSSYKDVAKRVKLSLSRKISRGPIDCPFCHKKVPSDSEYCPHCNFHLVAGGGPARYEAGEATPLGDAMDLDLDPKGKGPPKR